MFLAFRNKFIERRGQATVEAAFLIPVMMCLLLLMIEPGIVLYDRIVMNSAVSEGARLLSTQKDGNSELVEDYIKRRLGAIPSVDIFHLHETECSYEISCNGNSHMEFVTVSLKNKIKALPLLDIGLRAFGGVSVDGYFEISTSCSLSTQNDWAYGY